MSAARPALRPAAGAAAALRRAAAALGLLAPALACRATATIEDLDRLARSIDARTVLHERDFSLYSPFDLIETREWLRLVEEELADVARLLAADPAEQRARAGALIVWLHPVAGMRGRFEIDGGTYRIVVPDAHPTHGVLGAAASRRAVVLVEPVMELTFADGRTLPGTWAPSEYRSTLRHELAHVVAAAEGIAGEDWLAEGVAALVQHARAGDADDGVRIDPRILREGRRLARERPALRDLLIADEDARGIHAGRVEADPTWRPRLLAFFAFLLERETARGGGLRSTLGAARDAGRAELSKLDSAWRAWLEVGPLDVDPAVAGASEPPERPR